MSTDNVDLTIRAKNATEQAFAAVSKALKELEGQTTKTSTQGRTIGDGFFDAFGKAKGAIGGVLSALGPIGSAVAGAFSVGAVIGFAKEIGTFAGRMTDLSAETQINVERLQAWNYHLTGAGLTVEAFTGAVTQLQRRLAGGDQSAAAAVERLGLSVDELLKMAPDDAVIAIVEAVAKLENQGAKTTTMFELFGRTGSSMLRIVDASLGDTIRTIEQSGAIIDKELIAKADAFDDAWSQAWIRVRAATVSGVSWMADALKGFGSAQGDTWDPNLEEDALRNLNRKQTGDIISGMARPEIAGGLKAIVPTREEIAAIERQTGALKDNLDERLKLAKASEVAAEAQQKLRASMFGLDVIDRVEDMVKAMGGLPGVTRMGADEQKKFNALLNQAIDASVRNGKVVPVEWMRIEEATRAVAATTIDWTKALGDVPEAMQAIQAPIATLQSSLRAIEMPWNTNTGLGNQQATAAAVAWARSLGQQIPDGLSAPGSPVIQGFKLGFSRVSDALPGLIQQSLTGGGGIRGALNAAGAMMGDSLIKGIFGEVGKSGMLKGVTGMLGDVVGSVIPVVGGLIGPAISGLGKLFGGMFGGEGKKTNKERDSWVMEMVGINDLPKAQDALRQMAAEAGVTDAEMRKLFDSKKLDSFHAAQQVVLDKLKAHHDLTLAGQEAIGQKQELLNAAIQRYGFSIEELGPAMQRQRLAESAEELITDYDLLTESGIGVATVTAKMSERINEFISHAVRTGTEVPEAMRPMVESLIANRQLLDENGQAYTSVEAAGITFGESLTTMFKDVLGTLRELIDSLKGTGSAINNLPSQKTIDIVTRYSQEGAPPSEVPAPDLSSYGYEIPVPGAAAGGIFSQPTFRVVAESQPEIVGSPNVIVDALAQAMQRVGAPAGGGDQSIVAAFVLDGAGGVRAGTAEEAKRIQALIAKGLIQIPQRAVVNRVA